MTPPLPPVVLAFQVWDAVGWFGQAIFTLRVLQQWFASERAGRSLVPPSFWTWSLVGTLALVVYCLHRKDPVFLAGALVNGFIYLRNWRMTVSAVRGKPVAATPIRSVALGVGVFLAVTAWTLLGERSVLRFDYPWNWLIVGFAGQALWSSRFVVQWFASERAGRSVMPASFFWISLAGAVLLFTWAVYRVDWVYMAAYALNPVPYVRNLILIHREHARGPGGSGPPSDPG
jgi:lipid-A-disaccharide synthase-like uncharacterized protein